jgi:hypothetical protein
MLRRLKSEVLTDLPERIFSNKYLNLSDKAYDIYISYAKQAYEDLITFLDVQKSFEKIT